MTLIQSIQSAIFDDDTDDSDKIIDAYEHLDPRSKEAVDDIFISLCGWSLTTLIENL